MSVMRKFGIAFAIVAMAMIIALSCGFIDFTSNTNTTTGPMTWATENGYSASFAHQTPVPNRTERDIGALVTLAGTQINQTEMTFCYLQDTRDRHGPAQPVREAMVRGQFSLTTEYKALSLARDWPTELATITHYNTAMETSIGDHFVVACIQRRGGGSSSYM